MNYDVEPIVLNTDDLTAASPGESMWVNRAAAYHMYDAPGVPLCSIMVTGYNRLNKTKYCVECILEYTQDVDYELILIDNGSHDGTYDFFQSVPYNNKQIIKVTKNIGAGYAVNEILKIYRGKYLVSIPNDVYVTKNWLSNLLKCYESDVRIGLVQPVSSNVSNLQQVDLNYKNFDDMQKKSAAFNQSDPSKWEERMRLITVAAILSRQIIQNVGLVDSAFVHDFIEDDLCARIRRAGYKLMLCRDTWICHDHDFRNMEDKNPDEFQKNLEGGRAIYREKYHGIDAWDDILNFEFTFSELLKSVRLPSEKPHSLVIDGRCGTPVLEIRNALRRCGVRDVISYAFTTQAKYYHDLQTAADDVKCDRIDFIQSYYADNTFDIIALCEPINIYPRPVTMLQSLYNFLKPKGVLMFKLRNTDDFNAFLRSAGIGGISDGDLPAVLPVNEVQECLKLFGGQDMSITFEHEGLSDSNQKTLLNLLRSVKSNADKNDLARLITKNYVFRVIKKG